MEQVRGSRSRLVALVLVLASAGAELWADEAPGPVKVFILAGQSNMQGHAHVRTLEALALDPESASIATELCDASGRPRVCDDVWISSLSSGGVRTGRLTAGFGADENKIGPEFAFGVTARKRLGVPIVIIKAAWGGKSLHTDFRPPSAGPYIFTEAQKSRIEKRGDDPDEARAEKERATGLYYRRMVEHVRSVLADLSALVPGYDATRGYELAGFVWFQGWNDMVDGDAYPLRDEVGGYDAYSVVLTHFIDDVRRDLSAPELPFVIGVMGVGGPTTQFGPDEQRSRAVQQRFRDAMAAPASDPRFAGTVTAVRTEAFWDIELGRLWTRDQKLRRALEERREKGEISRAEEEAQLEEARAAAFAPRERTLLEKGVSNAEYHYLGSAKILSKIGRAFAEPL
ncbi:MAG: hypothetical protein KDC38_00105 [Planctomycetes bacterium]|nr:hypothetical protein [Planctomycetota bacterium]